MRRPPNEPDFLPTASLPILRLRSEMLDWMRQFFRKHGYWEVETPILSRDVCVDAWLEPFCVQASAERSSVPLFLQTSPEFGMKRLLAAGADSIFQITRAFRQEESGRLHNPEFTIVEWYQVGATYFQQMELVEKLAEEFHHHIAIASCGIEGLKLDDPVNDNLAERQLSRPFCRLTYEDAFLKACGEGVLAKSVKELRSMAKERGITSPSSLHDEDWDGWLNLLLSEMVEPMLEQREAVFLYDYPASQAALARIRHSDPPVAERFELYVQGIEICNGYQELIDSQELRRRQSEQTLKRQKEGRPSLPEHSRLLEAMDAGLPDCSGVALGFDRLLLAALGKSSLADVTTFPFDRA